MPDRREYDKRYYLKNKEKLDKKAAEYRVRMKQEAFKLFGNHCVLCKYDVIERLRFHRKDGESHSSPTWRLALKNPDEYALVCRMCHRGVHFCMEVLNMLWTEITVYINRR